MKISVIVPVYKVEPYLRKCIDSVLAQTFKDFELILIDDGSPDNCGRICDECAVRDIHIKVIHQKNSGLSAARNAGIDYVMSHSKSEYITFVDSDDWVEPNYLEELLNGVRAGAKVSCTACAYVYENESLNEHRFSDRGWRIRTPEDFWLSPEPNATISCAKLFHRSCFADVRFPVGRLHEDVFTTYRLIFQVEQVASREMPTYNYRMRSDSIVHSTWTPRRLDVIDGMREQVAFFKERGFLRVYEFARGYLLAEMANAIMLINEFDPQKAEEFRSFIRAEISVRPLSFWLGRAYYRAIMRPVFFWPCWMMGMMVDLARNRSRSWFAQRYLPFLFNV